jgi:cell wall assembly regulator SMI1
MAKRRSAGGDGRAAWDAIVKRLGASVLGVRPGASEAEIVETEHAIGTRLPESYRAWLAQTDGQAIGALEILPSGGRLRSLAELRARHAYERGFDLDTYDDIVEEQDRGRIRWFVFHPRRITIAGNQWLDGDNVSIDLWPGRAGTEGQVIVATNEADFIVLGLSFGELLDRIAILLEENALEPRQVDDEFLLQPVGTEGYSTFSRPIRKIAPKLVPR